MTLPFKPLAAAAALAVTPMTASAATMLFADTFETFAFTITPGSTVTFDFVVAEELDIEAFAISGTGDDEDLSDITFDYDTVVGDSFDTITTLGPIASGSSLIAGFGPFSVGDTFSFTFNDGIDKPASMTLSFFTEAPGAPVVPLPAGVALLMSALGGLALWRRRQTEV